MVPFSQVFGLPDSSAVPDEPHSLLRYRYEDPSFQETEEAAAADVAAVEEDAKYFGSDSPPTRTSSDIGSTPG